MLTVILYHDELEVYSSEHNATNAKLVEDKSQLAIISNNNNVIDFDKAPASMKYNSLFSSQQKSLWWIYIGVLLSVGYFLFISFWNNGSVG